MKQNRYCKDCNKLLTKKIATRCHACQFKINAATRRKPFVYRDGYRYLHRPDHPRAGKQGYIAEHRLVMEEKIGRYLTPKEVVHHIDENRENNHPDNLQLFASRGQHTKHAHPETINNLIDMSKGVRRSIATEFKKGHIPWSKQVDKN